MSEKGLFRGNLFAGFSAVLLVGIFICVNHYLDYRDTHQIIDPLALAEREHLPAHLEDKGNRLAFYDLEPLKMGPAVAFSPGLWIKFKDLNPSDASWIRVTGKVWFSCPVSEAKCSLVATCNHQGVNFKYMFVALEHENLEPNQWNRVSNDYHVPQAPDGEDVLQAYFWYRGKGEMLVDSVEVTRYEGGGRFK